MGKKKSRKSRESVHGTTASCRRSSNSESDSDEAIDEFVQNMSKIYDQSKMSNQINKDSEDIEEGGTDSDEDPYEAATISHTSANLKSKGSAQTESSDEELDYDVQNSSSKNKRQTGVNKNVLNRDENEITNINYNREQLEGDSSEEETDYSSSDNSEDSKKHITGREQVSQKSECEDDNLEDEKSPMEEEEDEEEECAKIRAEIADMPFEELQKLKETVGLKMFNQAMSIGVFKNANKKTFKRENKNRPMEMSSKRTAQKFKNSGGKKKVHRDPRFDDLSGEFNETYFKQAYSFLTDVKTREKQKLIKRFNKEKDEEKKAELDYMIKRLTQQEKAAREKEAQAKKDRQWKQKQNELVKEGKNPYYLKKSTKKTLQLADKYQELKKSGKIENYLAKKRKKNATKERKKLPSKM